MFKFQFMAYKYGQIEITPGRHNTAKKKMKRGYSKKLRRELKNVEFEPANHRYWGYQ